LWLKSQKVDDPAVAAHYNVTDLFELKAARFHEIGQVSMPGNSYAIDHPQPLNGTIYQDNWIGSQAIALLKRRPMTKPFFLEVSHQAPHPPMDVTAGMVRFEVHFEAEVRRNIDLKWTSNGLK